MHFVGEEGHRIERERKRGGCRSKQNSFLGRIWEINESNPWHYTGGETGAPKRMGLHGGGDKNPGSSFSKCPSLCLECFLFCTTLHVLPSLLVNAYSFGNLSSNSPSSGKSSQTPPPPPSPLDPSPPSHILMAPASVFLSSLPTRSSPTTQDSQSALQKCKSAREQETQSMCSMWDAFYFPKEPSPHNSFIKPQIETVSTDTDASFHSKA